MVLLDRLLGSFNSIHGIVFLLLCFIVQAIYHAGTDTCIRTPEGDASAGSRHAQCIIGRIKPDVDLEQRVLAAWRNKENARQLLGPAYKNATIVV